MGIDLNRLSAPCGILQEVVLFCGIAGRGAGTGPARIRTVHLADAAALESAELDTEFAPKFEVNTQKSPRVDPSDRIVNATGFAPVETVPPFTVMAVSAPVT